MNALDDLLLALGGAPALPGARCRGRAHLFDPATVEESAAGVEQRHAQALRLCGGCPALAACEMYVESLAPKDRPPGVVAGRRVAS